MHLITCTKRPATCPRAVTSDRDDNSERPTFSRRAARCRRSEVTIISFISCLSGCLLNALRGTDSTLAQLLACQSLPKLENPVAKVDSVLTSKGVLHGGTDNSILEVLGEGIRSPRSAKDSSVKSSALWIDAERPPRPWSNMAAPQI